MATTMNPTGITGCARGIALSLDGFVIESYTDDVSPISEPLPDQNGAIAGETVYDHRYDLSLTVHSKTSSRTAPATTDDNITFNSKTWRVDKVSEAGSYNGLLRWTITAHRYDLFPAQSSSQNGGSGNPT